MEKEPMQNELDFTLEDIIREFGSGDTTARPQHDVQPAPLPMEPQPKPAPAPAPQKAQPKPAPAPTPQKAQPQAGNAAASTPFEPTIVLRPVQPKQQPAQQPVAKRTFRDRLMGYEGGEEDFEQAHPKTQSRAVPDAQRPEEQPEKTGRKPQQDPYEDTEFFALEAKEENYEGPYHAEDRRASSDRNHAPDWEVRDTQALLRDAAQTQKSLDLRLKICLVFTVVSVLLTAYNGLGLTWISGFENVMAMGIIVLILLVLAVAAAWDVLACGIRQLMEMQFGAQALLVILLVLELVEGVLAVLSGRLPLAAAVSVQLLIAMWGAQLKQRGLIRTARTLRKLEQPVGVISSRDVWKQHDGLYCTEGSVAQFEQHLEQPELPQKVLRIYVPVVLALAVILSTVSAIRGGADFFWAITMMLTVALPLGWFICYAMPFCVLAQRLVRDNAVFCGWYGAARHHHRSVMVLKDQDLFPEGTIRLSGVKIFDGYSSARVIGYAAAVLRGCGSGLASLLERQLLTEGGVRQQMQKLRRYDDAGMGAEFGADSVLVGTLGFMKKMGVHMDAGTRVKSALYISVNGELAGVAALQYTAAPEIRKGLQLIDRSGKLKLVLATCDFMITPLLLKQKFKIRPEHVTRPNARERAALAERAIEANSAQSALMSGYHFGTFARVAVGGRLLKMAVQAGTLLSVVLGLLGMLIVFLICLTGSFDTLTSFHLLVFMLVWLVPALLLGNWTRQND